MYVAVDKRYAKEQFIATSLKYTRKSMDFVDPNPQNNEKWKPAENTKNDHF
jgi:hypothetical protein